MILNLKELADGQEVRGLVLVQEHGKKTDTSNRPLTGTFIHQGKVLKFNIWASNSQALIDVLNQYDCSGRIIEIGGRFKKSAQYGDSIDVTHMNFQIEQTHPDVGVQHFLKTVPNLEGLATEFWNFLGTELKEEHFKVVQTIMQHDNLWSRFTTTFAGKKMHDAQVGGLMNHTYKMMKIAKTLLQNDPRFEHFYSLFQLSLLLHDIGKTEELGLMGEYAEDTFVTHRIIGIELMGTLKSAILNYIPLHDYRVIVSVMQGHHGEYADKPNSVWALFAHQIDVLDATVTGVLDALENGETTESYGAKRVYVHGENLAL